MRAPDFWWRERPSGVARLLAPLGLAYGAVSGRRMAREGVRVGRPVICVGNVTVGGAGKTPTALALAALLAERGETPVFLSRGHGGRHAGPLLVDPARHGAEEVGDEPLLLAAEAPTVVARDRVAGASLALEVGASAVVMDDGLQNPSLAKDLALAVVDGAAGLGNGLVLPAGPLRAPMARQWPRIDALVVVGECSRGERIADEARGRGLPVLTARLVPDPVRAAGLRGVRVLAFAGIGRPEKVFSTLVALGAVVVAREAFPDHHRYEARDVARLAARARREGLRPVTTAKDAVRLVGLAHLLPGLAILPVTLAFDDLGATRGLLAAALSRDPAP